ncbi:Rv1733c family protein [Saccharopolyspora phatthalungensis]|uniref:Transmembrane protein n=1 Tax=Saccharopolyspora phatthalungensis TaxID=664693 RepID=A0A840QAY3_9PSEU|nr:hypothetical protein [Saccharopolyspora phatthalungensis]MBB5159702.1 hypothetical protein [Saccharopolyspora phatthalungensis]
MNRGCVPAGAGWLIHALGLTANPLRRRLDRVAAAAVLGVLIMALTAVPLVAIAWGNAAYQAGQRAAAVAAATRHTVDAVVTGQPTTQVLAVSPDAQVTSHRAEVRWTGADGAPRVETVEVPPGSVVGSKMPLWVDTSERIVAAPPGESQARGSAFGVAFGAILAGEALCVVLIAGVLAIANGCAERAWHREWEIIEPKWTRQG